ncbi:MAG: hypothetical protein H3C62_05660 [Gemmatimonadaceae bacterium]|nr:hypothetical protein [Gemmatimonadaceae bacterium]
MVFASRDILGGGDRDIARDHQGQGAEHGRHNLPHRVTSSSSGITGGGITVRTALMHL